jgi:hypothetical protein
MTLDRANLELRTDADEEPEWLTPFERSRLNAPDDPPRSPAIVGFLVVGIIAFCLGIVVGMVVG